MFRDAAQASAVIRVLLRSANLEGIWDPTGLSSSAVQVLLERGEPPSDVEAIILLACFDLWNGTGKLEFGELVTTLDGPRLHLLGSLMMALGEGVDAVDHWIDEHSEAALVPLRTSGRTSH